MIRLFAAIAVPWRTGEQLAQVQAGLAGARWRPMESLHITLRFAGDIAETRGEDLDCELAMVGVAPFDLALAGVGTFGERPAVHSLWAGVDGGEPLTRLAARCETAARRAGLKRETRVFRPHVTLASVRGVEPTRIAAWIQGASLLKWPPFRVEAFGLYSSWRGAEAPVYRLERVYPLR